MSTNKTKEIKEKTTTGTVQEAVNQLTDNRLTKEFNYSLGAILAIVFLLNQLKKEGK